MALAMFRALPAYFGGKRRLTGEIFRSLPSPAQAPRLLDAFCGGGSVSIYAKAKGYQVIANDIAERSYIVAKALIENIAVKIEPEDVLRLFIAHPDQNHFAEMELCPDVLTSKQAKFLDTAVANAKSMPEPKRWLMLLLVVKYVLRMRPMGNFGAKTIIHQMEAGDWQEINPNYVKDALNRKINCHPSKIAQAIAHEINRGVFANGQANQAHCMDIFALLPTVQADIAYFDPPYAGTLAYETALKPLDDFLRGHAEPAEKSVFSQSDAVRFLDQMFDRARHIPVWAISYGNAKLNLDDLVAMIRRHKRVVEARELHHVHCTGLASAESKAANREFILIGRDA